MAHVTIGKSCCSGGSSSRSSSCCCHFREEVVANELKMIHCIDKLASDKVGWHDRIQSERSTRHE